EVELAIDALKRIAAAYLGLKIAPGTAPGRRGEAEMRKLRHGAVAGARISARCRDARGCKGSGGASARCVARQPSTFPFAKEGHQQLKAWEREHGSLWDLKTAASMGLENSSQRRRARGTRSIRIIFGCA